MRREPLCVARCAAAHSSFERLAELATGDDAYRAAAEVQDELAVASPEAALEIVWSEYETALPRADVEEQRLDLRVVAAQQHLLQPRVQLAAVEPARQHPSDERRPIRAGEQDEHRAADQAE